MVPDIQTEPVGPKTRTVTGILARQQAGSSEKAFACPNASLSIGARNCCETQHHGLKEWFANHQKLWFANHQTWDITDINQVFIYIYIHTWYNCYQSDKTNINISANNWVVPRAWCGTRIANDQASKSSHQRSSTKAQDHELLKGT